uniref:Pre-rRNA-processing protein Ipi1 N-terminal domain-containing protein n=1 Tax=Parascaris univalens TaxID=6257 RepID=A0A915B8G0_PARUN
MGKKQNKRRKVKDFAKVRLKVGKKLKKPTSTDTNFKTKKVVLVDQLSTSANICVSHRGLTLDELCRQLGHYNLNKMDTVSYAQLRALLLLLCTSSSRVISAHFALFMAHTLRALSHLKLSVRAFATSVLTVLMNSYPELCINCGDLFDAFLTMFAGNRKPSNKQLLVDALLAFLNVFCKQPSPRHEGPLHVATFSIESARVTRINLTPRPHLFGSSLFDSSHQLQKTALDSPGGVLKAFNSICPFLVILITDENQQFIGEATEVISKLAAAVLRVRQQNLPTEFETEFEKTIETLLVLAKRGNLPKKLHDSIDSLRLTK